MLEILYLLKAKVSRCSMEKGRVIRKHNIFRTFSANEKKKSESPGRSVLDIPSFCLDINCNSQNCNTDKRFGQNV